MTRLRVFASRIRGLFGRGRADRVLDDEIRAHLEMLAEDHRRRGLSPDEARAAAQRDFGGVMQVRETYRAVRALPWIETAVRDLRYAGRTLRARPTFALAGICTLALGIGANTAIFGVAYALLVRPLPYAAPEELVTIASRLPNLPSEFPTIPVRATDFLAFQRAEDVFADTVALRPENFNLTGDGDPERLYGARVSANLFSMLGANMHRGRGFRPEEDRPGSDGVVVISHALWLSRFGGRPDLVNDVIRLNGATYTVVGVLRRDFLFPVGKQLHPLVGFGPRVDIWKPMAFTDDEVTSEGSWNYGVIARLRPGVSPDRAELVLAGIARAISQNLRSRVPGLDFDLELRVAPLRGVFSSSGRHGLSMLAVAAGLLLVIACVNLAHLWFDRTIGRRREFAIRRALGAPTWRIVQQLLSESLLVAMGGCALGLVLAYTGTRLLAAIGPVDFQSMQVWRMDGPIVAFSAALALGAGLLFSAFPVLHTARMAAWHAWGRGPVADTRFPRLRRVLMIGQIALCTTVLAAAGLLLHSFARVSTMERGFVTGDVLAVSLALPAGRYDTQRTLMFYAEALDRIRASPGVVAAGAVTVPPLTSEENVIGIYAEEDLQESLQRPLALHRAVTTGYFSALGIPLVAGRLLEEREAVPAVVISERLSAAMWPGVPAVSAVGRRVRIGEVSSPLRIVVGVVGDVRDGALDRASLPAIYRPHQDLPSREMTLLVRSARDAAGLTASIRNEVRRLDRDLPLGTVRTMGDIVSTSLSGRRFQLVLVSLFAVLGLLLAAVGVYGVTSVSVTSRTQEIGVRLALGGSPGTVFRSALVDGLFPVGIGLLVGLVFACLAGFAMRRLLFGVAPIDPVTLTSVAVVFLGVGGIACYVPARRAAHLDPISALRCE